MPISVCTTLYLIVGVFVSPFISAHLLESHVHEAHHHELHEASHQVIGHECVSPLDAAHDDHSHVTIGEGIRYRLGAGVAVPVLQSAFALIRGDATVAADVPTVNRRPHASTTVLLI